MSASTHSLPTAADGEASPAAPVQPDSEAPVLEHVYDGIQEYDNPLPRWWVLFFWGSFWFSVGYVLWYHVFDRGASVAESYEAEMQVVRAELARRALSERVSEESLSGLVQDSGTLEAGKAVYEARCLPCHGARGEGLIGPNLTDSHFIHGGSLLSIYEVVSKGVADKGMPAWSEQLRPEELKRVVAFVGSLKGQNLPGKAPEGVKEE
ncbi:MAG TPA: cbb3-type cytochrome c oxidase N-terminal domain-containing protein [Polyangiaceae bacterium]|nr:cbb3-type cytochrome c oxidase N-terminal domain-containing protein [Polyangiaceae bacterium]